MNIQEELKRAVDIFTGMKRHACEIEGGPHDLAPMMHFKYKHLKSCCGGLLAGDLYQLVPMAWRKVLDQGIPEFMMLVVEGYSSMEPQKHERGSLEKDFKENPDSKVKEVITIQAVDIKTGEQFTAIVPYKYDDDGLPEFEDPSIGLCEGEALNTNIPAMFSALRNATLTFLEEAA
jgi:hypothetical protein